MNAAGGMRNAEGRAPVVADGVESPAGTLTVAAIVTQIAALLSDARAACHVPRPANAAREILAALLDMPRSWPALNGDVEVSADVRARARLAAERLRQGAPFAYAVGRASFRHLTLDVDERVLIPRPETEQLVDVVLELERGRSGGVAVDVGTGSGAIALALASEGHFDRVIATDVSLDALAVAGENARAAAAVLRARVDLVHCSLLDAVRCVRARVVVSNPPYIAHAEAAGLPASVRDWEPPVALFSGADGMAATTRLVRDAAVVLEPGGVLALEVDARRASLVAELLARDTRYVEVGVRLDNFGRERFVTGRRETR